MVVHPTENPVVESGEVALVLSPHTGRTVLLAEREQMILDFERTPWRYAGAKETRISETLGLTSTRYYQILNALLNDERAIAYDPVLIHRLHRARARRYYDQDTRS